MAVPTQPSCFVHTDSLNIVALDRQPAQDCVVHLQSDGSLEHVVRIDAGQRELQNSGQVRRQVRPRVHERLEDRRQRPNCRWSLSKDKTTTSTGKACRGFGMYGERRGFKVRGIFNAKTNKRFADLRETFGERNNPCASAWTVVDGEIRESCLECGAAPSLTKEQLRRAFNTVNGCRLSDRTIERPRLKYVGL